MNAVKMIRLQVLLCILTTVCGNFNTNPSVTKNILNHHTRSRRQVLIPDMQANASIRNRTYNAFHQRTVESGPWGPWTESSDCSRSCGGGVLFQDRICLDVRSDGSHSCVGPSRRYFSCNTDDCLQSTRDFRGEQCARFNSVPYNGKYYSWVPYYNAQNPCELNCMPQGGSFFARLDRSVIDGTRCLNDGSLNICVEGQCIPVGCDRVLGSTTQEDECRICGGDGSSCKIVKGVFDQDDFQIGYNDILLIPVGATSVLIQESAPTNNYLAIRNSAGEFYLNGNWRIEYPREIRIAGTIFQYERKSHGSNLERLRAKGPTLEPIFIVLLYQENNLGINYEYSIPATTKTFHPDSYSWTFGDFEECTQPCGGGEQYRPVRCIRNSNRDVVEDELCDILLKPSVNGTCNTQPCSANWEIGEWSTCNQVCGAGTQFRLVFCQQIKDGNVVLVPDEQCGSSKPLFMRACVTDKECPEWTFTEWSKCDKPCGSGNQSRSVKCFLKEENKTFEDSFCDEDKKPDTHQNCTLRACEGAEWIISEWSGCDGSCSPHMESREIHCATEDGTVFPNDACNSHKMPVQTRPCSKSAICEPMWHTSEWAECSVTCGTGIQSRVVFCGVWEENTVIKIDDSKCDESKKFEEIQNCSLEACQAIWFTGPWNRCSVPCGGGERSRKILCFHENDVVNSSRCDSTNEPYEKEQCNMKPCDADEIMVLSSCKESKYGCCPDGNTAAGFNDEDCPKMNIINSNTTCEQAEYGCCPDNFTLAVGPFKKGCSSNLPCNMTKFGCCLDQVTPAKGLENEGCNESESYCSNTTYGCCPDNITVATGFDNEGCESYNVSCQNTTYGCCLDDVTAATGPGLKGCLNYTFEENIESSGEDCSSKPFGCCPDGVTPALAEDQHGCDRELNITSCSASAFGCCDDDFTFAKGPSKQGCEVDESSGDGLISCDYSIFGCCPDNITLAKGINGEGCIPENCSNTEFGCCPDNVTVANGFDDEGCFLQNCTNSKFGCCPDNFTIALDENGKGCLHENCTTALFGCCPDNITAALDIDGKSCFLMECINSTFGCCPDNKTAATGPDYKGCLVIDCVHTKYGCCDDNITVALGPLYEGCELEIDCIVSKYGCCQDNATFAKGPEFQGCDETVNGTESIKNFTTTTDSPTCRDSQFGCCPDKVTVALGTRLEGCCFGMPFGCCPDNNTAALGPTFLGCGCQTFPYGCCPDEITPAQGFK